MFNRYSHKFLSVSVIYKYYIYPLMVIAVGCVYNYFFFVVAWMWLLLFVLKLPINLCYKKLKPKDRQLCNHNKWILLNYCFFVRLIVYYKLNIIMLNWYRANFVYCFVVSHSPRLWNLCDVQFPWYKLYCPFCLCTNSLITIWCKKRC